jgi:hypothetical protein
MTEKIRITKQPRRRQSSQASPQAECQPKAGASLP